MIKKWAAGSDYAAGQPKIIYGHYKSLSVPAVSQQFPSPGCTRIPIAASWARPIS